MRELIEKKNSILNDITEHAKTLNGEGFDKKAYDAKLDELSSKLEDVEREIKTEALVATPQGVVVEVPTNVKDWTKEENVTATEEYRKDYFKYLQGKLRLEDLEAKFGTSASNSMGASIPETTLNQIIDNLEQRSALLGISRVENIQGTLRIAVEKNNDGANLHTEGATITDEDLTLEEVTWANYEIAKLVRISKTVATQSISALESFIIDEISRKLAVKVEELMAVGTGTNQPTGILVDTRITNEVTLGALTYNNILSVIAALPTMYHQNARFAMSRQTYFNEVVGLVDNNGQPIFKITTAETGPAFSILGYPVEIVDQFPVHATASATDKTFVFGDFDYYLANFGMDATIDKSEHSSFKEGLVDYRGCLIFDSKVLDGRGFVRVVRSA